jgi:hypothetical protein
MLLTNGWSVCHVPDLRTQTHGHDHCALVVSLPEAFEASEGVWEHLHKFWQNKPLVVIGPRTSVSDHPALVGYIARETSQPHDLLTLLNNFVPLTT